MRRRCRATRGRSSRTRRRRRPTRPLSIGTSLAPTTSCSRTRTSTTRWTRRRLRAGPARPVIGTESTANIARAGGVPEAQISPGPPRRRRLRLRAAVDQGDPEPPLGALGQALLELTPPIPRDVKPPLRLKDYVEGGMLCVPPAAGRPRDPALRRDELHRAGGRRLTPGHRPGRGGPPTPRDPRLHRPAPPRARPPTDPDRHPLGQPGSPLRRAAGRGARGGRDVRGPRRRPLRCSRSRVVLPRHFETIVVDPWGVAFARRDRSVRTRASSTRSYSSCSRTVCYSVAAPGHLAGPAGAASSCSRTDRGCQPKGSTGDGAR